MFKALALGLAAATIYSDYPAFVRKGAVVEAFFDKGPIVEMIVRCGQGSGIISYSKIEKRYCSSKLHCYGRLELAVKETCG